MANRRARTYEASLWALAYELARIELREHWDTCQVFEVDVIGPLLADDDYREVMARYIAAAEDLCGVPELHRWAARAEHDHGAPWALCQAGCGLRPVPLLVPEPTEPPGLCDLCGGEACSCSGCMVEARRQPPPEWVAMWRAVDVSEIGERGSHA